MTPDLKALALAAVEAEKFFTVHPATMAFHDAATPQRIMQYRNEVLEEAALEAEAWEPVEGLLPLCDDDANRAAMTGQWEARERIAEAIRSLKTREPT